MTIRTTFEEFDAEFERLDGAKTRSAAEKPLSRLLRDYPDLNFGFGRGSIYWRAVFRYRAEG